MQPARWSLVAVRAHSRAEQIADGVIHVLGGLLALAGALFLLMAFVPNAGPGQRLAAVIYLTSLIAALAASAAYNMWPTSRVKQALRRVDHAMIFSLIAGTYTPLLSLLPETSLRQGLLVLVWSVAALGMVLKLAFPDRLARMALGLYLGLGWSGLVAINAITAVLPPIALWLILIGGLLYTTGVVFHVWHRLTFQTAIWHAFVLVAAICHYAAIVVSLRAVPIG